MAKTDTKYFSKMIMDRIPNREKPFDAHSPFSSLKVVINNCIADEYGEPLDLLSSFLKLPSLTEYYYQKISSHDDDADAELAQLKTVSSALTHLEVREYRLNVADLTTLLRICKSLRTFVYELGWGHISDCTYSRPGLRQAIAQIDQSLENLWLDYIPGPAYFERIDDYVPIDSLTTFSCLKNIKIGTYVLFGL